MDSAESPSRVSVTEPLPPSLLYFISNFHHLIPIKLNEHNYTIWKLQCEGALKASYLFDYVQGSQSPSPTIIDSTGSSIPNPAYFTWLVVESHLRSCLISTLSPAILSQVTHTRTAIELCQFLEHKLTKSNFAGKISGQLPSKDGRHSPRVGYQITSPVISQICANSASQCCHGFPGNFKPDKTPHDTAKAPSFASDSNANEVFDISPHRDLLAIADGSADSAANTGFEIVPSSHGRAISKEPDILVLNQSDTSFVEDRLVISPEEMMGNQTRQQSMNPERLPIQQEPEPQIAVARKEAISMQAKPEKNSVQAKPEKNSVTELTVTTPNQKIQNLQDRNLGEDSLQVNKKLNGGNATELAETVDYLKTKKLQEQKLEENSVKPNKISNGGKVMEVTQISSDQKIQNPDEKKSEENSMQLQKIQNLQERKPEANKIEESKACVKQPHDMNLSGSKRKASLPPCVNDHSSDPLKKNKMVCFCSPCQDSRLRARQNTGKNSDIRVSPMKTGNAAENAQTTSDQKIQKLENTDLEGKSLPVYKKVNGGNTLVLMGTSDEKTQKRKQEGESLQVNKKLNGGNAVKPKGAANSQKRKPEEKSVTVNKQLNGGNAIEIKTTADEHKILNTQERKLEEGPLQFNKKLNSGNAVKPKGTGTSQKIQNSLKRKPEEKVNKQLNGGNAIEIKTTADELKILKMLDNELKGNSLEGEKILSRSKGMKVAGTDDYEKIQKSCETKLEENPLQVIKELSGGSSIERQHEGNTTMEVDKMLNGGKSMKLTGSAADQKALSTQEKKLEENPLQVNRELSGSNLVELKETGENQKMSEMEGNSSVQANKIMSSENATKLTGTTTNQKIQNLQDRNLGEDSLQVNKKMNGGNALELADHQKTEKLQERKLEDSSLKSDKILNGGKVMEVTQISADQRIQNPQRKESVPITGFRKSLQASKIVTDGKNTELTGTCADQKIQNLQVRKLEEKSKQVDKNMNGCNAIELMETADYHHQKIQNSPDAILEGSKSLPVYKKLNGGNTLVLMKTTSETRKLEENSSQVNKNLSGGSVKQSDNSPLGKGAPVTTLPQTEVPGRYRYRFWCEFCKVGSNNARSHNEHINGKKHKNQFRIYVHSTAASMKKSPEKEKEPGVVAKDGTRVQFSNNVGEGLEKEKEPEVAAKDCVQEARVDNNVAYGNSVENHPVKNEKLVDGNIYMMEEGEINEYEEVGGQQKEKEPEVIAKDYTQETHKIEAPL